MKVEDVGGAKTICKKNKKKQNGCVEGGRHKVHE
jgi:hypothetical protein